MRGAEHDHRDRRIARLLLGDRDADRGVRIDEAAGLAQHGADAGGDLLLVGAVGAEQRADLATARAVDIEKRRDCASDAIRRAHRAAVAAVGLEQQPLEIRRHLDVHRRRRGRHHLAQLVGAGGERAHQDVVDVGRDHQPVDRQAHALGDIAGEHVAEISGRHREGDLAVRRAERDRRGEIIDRLRDDARPVDRVDAGQPHLVAEGVMVEQPLHDRLAIVERAFDRDRVDVVVRGRGHHPALHVGDAAVPGTARTGRRASGRGTPRPRRRRCRPRSRPRWWCARRARPARDPSAAPATAWRRP